MKFRRLLFLIIFIPLASSGQVTEISHKIFYSSPNHALRSLPGYIPAENNRKKVVVKLDNLSLRFNVK